MTGHAARVGALSWNSHIVTRWALIMGVFGLFTNGNTCIMNKGNHCISFYLCMKIKFVSFRERRKRMSNNREVEILKIIGIIIDILN